MKQQDVDAVIEQAVRSIVAQAGSYEKASRLLKERGVDVTGKALWRWQKEHRYSDKTIYALLPVILDRPCTCADDAPAT